MSFRNIDDALDEILQTDQYVEVSKLPWADSVLGHDGFYSGSVNEEIEPHGHGTWICSGPCDDQSHALSGNWYNGCFITNDWMDYIIEKAHDKRQERGRSRRRDDGTKKRVAFKSTPTIIGRKQHACSKPQSMPVYNLGEALRSQDHAMTTGPENTKMAMNLKEHHCAFIKRSDSNWTYSILAYRIPSILGENDCDRDVDDRVIDAVTHQDVDTNEDVMLFVLDKMGRTKAVRASSYGKYIRCVTEMPGNHDEMYEEKGVDSGNVSTGIRGIVDSHSAFQNYASPRRTFAARGA